MHNNGPKKIKHKNVVNHSRYPEANYDNKKVQSQMAEAQQLVTKYHQHHNNS